MIITPIEHGLDLAHSYGHRSPGTHMSDLYGDYYAALEPDRYGRKEGDALPMERWGAGMAFEDMLEEGLKARAFNTNDHEIVARPPEQQTRHAPDCPRDPALRTPGMGCVCGGGVYFSPDLFILNGGLRIGEIKLNSMSAKGVPWKLGETYSALAPKFDKFICQLRLYCFHVGTQLGRLYSFSVREMVHFNEPDIFRAWDIEFSQVELEEEWEIVRNHSIHKGLLK